MAPAPAPPPSRAHRFEFVSAQADVDELGHISNVSYVRWLQDGAIALSVAAGFDLDTYRTLGCVFVVRRHEIEYLRPAYAGERIALVTWIEGVRGAQATCCTRIVRAGSNEALAVATSTWVLVSFESQRPRRIPPHLARAFGIGEAPDR